jgi:hypothetical protein
LILILYFMGRATQCREPPPKDYGAQDQLCRRPELGSAPDYPDTVLPVLFALFIVWADTFAAADHDIDEVRRSGSLIMDHR